MSVRVKVCGIRRLEDALLAAELGAAALGFVFWPDSPRFVDPYRARTIAAALPPWVAPVGVFVNQPADYVAGVARLVNLAAVQLHGDEAVQTYERSPYRVIKAVAVNGGFDPASLGAIPPQVTVLLDAHDPIKRGGTGRAIDWSIAARVAAARRTILSGGLNAQNVRSAVEAVRPYGVDVSSGVEGAPGIKDPDKLREFFSVIHG